MILRGPTSGLRLKTNPLQKESSTFRSVSTQKQTILEDCPVLAPGPQTTEYVEYLYNVGRLQGISGNSRPSYSVEGNVTLRNKRCCFSKAKRTNILFVPVEFRGIFPRLPNTHYCYSP